MKMRALGPALLCAALVVPALAGGAGTTFFGPTPYLSAADSPFDLGAPGFCLEDFEDGVFDTIGASGNGSVVAPGGITDSVDADDGIIDGSGTGGHSYFNGSGAVGITITFDPGAPGGLPTAAGMVWTDGAGTITFEAFDQNGMSLGTMGPFDHADGSFSGGTAEDRFYGVVNPTGVSAIKLSNTSGGIEVDHVQYNNCFAVPPTSTTTSTTTTTLATSTTSTTTTLPGDCAAVAVGPTFASLDCRLTSLIASVQAETQLGKLQPKLVKAAEKAKQREEAANGTCIDGNAKASRKQLKKVVRKLIQFAHRLRSNRARQKVPEGVREPLAESADQIQQDARSLEDSLACGV